MGNGIHIIREAIQVKKRKFNLVLLNIFFGALITLSACENVAELEEIISYQDNRIVELEIQLEEIISYQDSRIVEFEAQLEDQIELNATQQDEIEFLNQEIEENQLYEWQIILADDLMENIEELAVEFLAGNPQIDSRNDILFPTGEFWTRGYVVARLSPRRPATYVILSYQVLNEEGEFVFPYTVDWRNYAITWKLVGHVTSLSGLRFVEEFAPQHLTDLEMVTIRIYTFDWDVEEWKYSEEDIAGEELWEEVIRLMPEVRNLWYEETTLYVDLFASEWHSVGGMGDILAITRLSRIFSSFPYVSEIRFLTEGQIGFPFYGYGPDDFMHIFDVENARWLFLCELAEGDTFFVDEDRWGIDMQERREAFCN